MDVTKLNVNGTQKDIYELDKYPRKDSDNLIATKELFTHSSVIDISELNATENPHTLAKYENLSAALAALPSECKRGGMTIRYVQNSDNKYVQYRYTVESIESAYFTNEANWELDVTKKNLSEDFLGLLSEIKDFIIKNYSIAASGKFGSSTDYKHAVLSVNEGEVYYLIGQTSTCRAAFATTDESSSGADVPVVSGTGIMLMSSAQQYYKFIIPQGCTHLIFSASGSYGTRCYKHYDSLKEGTDEYTDNVPTAGSDNLVKSGGVDLGKVDVNSEGSKNRLNPKTCKAKTYINRNTGEEGSNNSYYATDFIQVSESGLYCNKSYGGSTSIGGAVYDSNHSYLRAIETTAPKKYVYQVGDAYVRFTLSTLENAQVEVGDAFTSYEPYNQIAGYTAQKIADGIVTNSKISDNAVNNAKITNNTITSEKLAYLVQEILDKSRSDIGYNVSQDSMATYATVPSSKYKTIPVGSTIINSGVKIICGSNSQLSQRLDIAENSTVVTTFEIEHIQTSNVSGNVDFTVIEKGVSFIKNGVVESKHIKDGAITTSKILDRNITSEKVELDAIGTEHISIAKSINIYDFENDSDYVEKKYLNNNGGLNSDSQSYDTSGFIPVKPNTTYSGSTEASFNFYKVCYYTSNSTSSYIDHSSLGIHSFTTPANTKFIRVSFHRNSLPKNRFICEGNERMPYSVYNKQIERKYIQGIDIEPIFFLPKHIYVATGRTIELYYSQILLNAERYNISATCSIGKALDRKFQIIGGSTTGNYTLTVTVYDDTLNKLIMKTSTVHVVSNIISSQKNILPVGDSITNDKPWLSELHTLSGNLVCVGTRGSGHEGRSGVGVTAYTDISGSIVYSYSPNYRGVGYGTAPTFSTTENYNEGDIVKTAYTFGNGSSGYRYWVFKQYHAAGAWNDSEVYCIDGGNPFYDYVNDGFSMSFYKTFQNKSYDAIIIFLGTNGINLKPETNTNGALGIKNLIDLIRVDEPTIPIIVVNTIFRSSQNGIGNQGNTDGYHAQSEYKFNADRKVLLLAKALQDMIGNYNNVYLCPVGFTHDSKYNFGNTKVQVNPRLTNTDVVFELQPEDSIHPQNSGYMQMADEIFSTLCAVFNV